VNCFFLSCFCFFGFEEVDWYLTFSNSEGSSTIWLIVFEFSEGPLFSNQSTFVSVISVIMKSSEVSFKDEGTNSGAVFLSLVSVVFLELKKVGILFSFSSSMFEI